MAEFTIAEQMQLTQGMTDQQQFLFQTQFAAVRKDRVMIFLVSFFLGALGIDRFLLGDVGLGLLKLLTAGVLGIFWFIDLFLIMGRTDDYNRAKAYQIASFIRASGPVI
jgi:TM2 domain-containing membrane protein YozV